MVAVRAPLLVAMMSPGGLTKPVVFHLDWTEQGESWFFVPSLTR